eukprot:5815210-Amphidinium_carterae.1
MEALVIKHHSEAAGWMVPTHVMRIRCRCLYLSACRHDLPLLSTVNLDQHASLTCATVHCKNPVVRTNNKPVGPALERADHSAA